MIQYLKNLFSMKHECEHAFRCIHGDEIIWHRYNRSICIRCGHTYKSLPLYCYYTKEVHDGYLSD